MKTISKAMEKARRNAAQHEGLAIDGSSGPLVSAQNPRYEPSDDIRSNLRVGRFDQAEPHLVTLVAPESAESEHYWSLRFTVERGHVAGRATIIGISSASPKDGKTLTTLNLAGALARDKKTRVLVVDTDLRNPSVGKYLGLVSKGPGLSRAVLQEDSPLTSIARWHPDFNFAILAAGVMSATPYEVLKSTHVDALFAQARRLFDFVLVDMPPLVFPECRVVNERVDGLLVVVAAHRTRRRDLKHGLESLDSSKVMGIVFNRDTEQKSRIPSYYQYRRR